MLTAHQSIPPNSGGEQSIHWAVPLGGLALSVIMFFATRGLRKRHWQKVKSQPGAGEFSAVWTDVLLQLVAALSVLIGLAAILVLFVSLRPHFS